MTPDWIRVGKDSVSIDIRARPGAARSAIIGADPRGLVVAIGAVAEKGKANDELERLMANLARVARSNVTIIRGKSTRSKSVRITTADPRGLAERLAAIGSPT